INPDCRKSLFLKEVIAYRYKQACKCLAEGKKSSISVDPPITSVEFVTGILEAANPRSSQPTWGIKKPLIPSGESMTGILEAANPRSSQPTWGIKNPLIPSVESVTGILEAANPRSSQPTWGIKKPLIPSVESVTGILEAANPRSSQPRWVIKKVPDWAHSITPKKYSRHPSEKNTRPLDSLEGTDILCASAAAWAIVFVFCYGISFFRPK
ncbi:hypothetical protein Tco_0017436, partial [Tanacetum coccineum]